jgi:diguanylate cyclase (GGDEF)-like protein
MRASRTLLFLTFWPVLLLVIFEVAISYWSLSTINTQSTATHNQQLQDLAVVQQAALFSQDIGGVHQKVSEAINQAQDAKLSEVKLYILHTEVVDTLALLGEQVDSLVNSELLREVNHGSVLRLQQAFEGYRRFIIMATDIIAIDPNVAQDYVQQAQVNFVQFSVYIQRITYLLSQRAQVRTEQEFASQQQFFYGVVVAGLVGLSSVLLIILVISGLISRKILHIADALSIVANMQDNKKIALPHIEKMQATDGGEFGRIAGALLGFRDAVARRKQAEAEAFQLAFYDPLTQLPNRRLLLERLQLSLSMSTRNKQLGALLYFDLDNFKAINDAQGHQTGDLVLVELAERLGKWAEGTDHIARAGGDEFVVTLESLGMDKAQAASRAEQAAESLREVLNKPYKIHDTRYFSSPSIGVVLFGESEDSVDELLKQAETAMYSAKSNGRNQMRFYDPLMQQVILERARIESELRDAIVNNQLQLFYQVQVDQSGRASGAEALIRWHHPEKGLVSPAEFIPIAEETGQIVAMGEWVLITACQQLSRWQQQSETAHLTLSVNVSARQFKEQGFVQQLADIISQSAIRPQYLKIELTESTILDNVEDAIEKMKQLRQLSVKFSLDDFGTGYSSLQYLKRLPLDQIKIDQSFVRDIVDDPDDAIIVQTIIAMSHALGIEVIAEGVETPEQAALLAQKGCGFYQGYYFGKPSPIHEFDKALSKF